MKYRIETDRGYDDWDNVQKIDIGGNWYYIYKNDEPYLAVSTYRLFSGPFSDPVIFNDYLVAGEQDIRTYDDRICFIRLNDFERKYVEVDGYLGYFLIDRDILYALCMKDVMAFNSNLDLIWRTGSLAVDGVVFKSIEGNTMTLECEMDPPGGWIERKISLLDGSIIS